MNNNWSDYLYLLKIAEFRNLQQAASALKVNSSTVYRRLNALEEKLNIKLFDRSRSHQGYNITAEGEEILSKLKEIENLFQFIEDYFSTEGQQIHGRIKIATSDGIGAFWLSHYIRLFEKEYPHIHMELTSINRNDRLDEKDTDFTLILAHKTSEYMESKKIQNIPFSLYATGRYIEQTQASLNKNEALEKNVNIILPHYDLNQFKASRYIYSQFPDEDYYLKSDSFMDLYHYCLHDLGAALLPCYMGEKNKDLQKILDIPKEFSAYLWLLTHPHKKLSAVSRLFIKFIVQQLLNHNK